MKSDPLIRMFCDGTVYSFERANEHSRFTFGGPLEARLTGMLPRGPHPLHQVARLPLFQLPELRERFGYATLSLIYGFTYEDCEIKYRIKSTGSIDILAMSPKRSSEDFPYANYPLLLPYVPLTLSEVSPCTYAEFADETTNLVTDQPSELIVTVHPPATLGVSLWGWSGDDSDATVVFECDLAERLVKAYNRFIS